MIQYFKVFSKTLKILIFLQFFSTNRTTIKCFQKNKQHKNIVFAFKSCGKISCCDEICWWLMTPAFADWSFHFLVFYWKNIRAIQKLLVFQQKFTKNLKKVSIAHLSLLSSCSETVNETDRQPILPGQRLWMKPTGNAFCLVSGCEWNRPVSPFACQRASMKTINQLL